MINLKSAASVALALSLASPAYAFDWDQHQLPRDFGHTPRADGRIVNWGHFIPPATNFVSGADAWTKSNMEMTFHKLYDQSVIHCDVMVDVLTQTNHRISIGLFIDNDTAGVEQSLAGSPAYNGVDGVITFGYPFESYRVTPAGDHHFYIYTSVADGQPATFLSKYALITCFERLLPPANETSQNER